MKVTTLRFLTNLLLILLSFNSTLKANTLTVYTDEFPPFNYIQDGKIIGASTEVVRAIMEISEQDYIIKSYPWARSYRIIQTSKNALIYSISRRQKREGLFKWIGVITPANHSIFALKNRTDIIIDSLDDMKPYIIGTSFDDARESYLANKGFDVSTFERVGGNTPYAQLYLQLKRGRIDLWPMPNAVMNYLVRDMKEDPNKVIKKVYTLDEISQEGYYIAASLTTSDAIVQRLRRALTEFKQTKAYTDIIEKWGL